MRKTITEKNWEKEHDAFEQLSIIKSWAEYEYSDVIDCCGTVENVIKLYKFTHFHL